VKAAAKSTDGPRENVEEAAQKAKIDSEVLEQARARLGVTATRANNAGAAHSVEWQLPG